MIIDKSINGFIPAKDLTVIIQEYLKQNGYENAVISYKIESKTSEWDTFAQHPPENVLSGISFTCKQSG